VHRRCVAAHEVSRAVGESIREGGMLREGWRPLIWRVRPRRERAVVMGERLVRAAAEISAPTARSRATITLAKFSG